MSDLRLLSLSVLFILLMVPAAAARFSMAKPGCNDTCGNGVTIPYPFGIGRDCALNESYTIYCNGSLPYLKFPAFPVLEVSLRAQTITLNYSVFQICLNQTRAAFFGSNITRSPFFYSGEYNKLMLLGCGNVRLRQKFDVQGRVLSGCTSICEHSSNISGCYGTNCCEASFSFYLNSYYLFFKNVEVNTTGYNCSSAILVDQKWTPENYSDLFVRRSESSGLIVLSNLYVPVVLSWILRSPSDVDTITGCMPKMRYVPVNYTSNITAYQCECDIPGNGTWFYEINPYLDGACNYAISQIRKKDFKAAAVGASVGFGVLFLMLGGLTLYKVIKKRQNRKRKEKFFKQNGGLLLQQQLSADEGGIEKTMIFTAKELNKASDGFNENRILGQGGQGTVYKGMLTDGRIVAIKKSKKVDKSQLEQFINEVVILSQVNHRNVVKLLGACLETEVPLLVYEFIPNGTLFSLIHNGNDDEFPLTWNLRLRIATEVAGALAYLHSAISIPIYHRDIKSSNILLDEKYIAKVSDFGISRSVATDKTHLTTIVQGTFGYMDPEYFQSSQFTEKSDVYSFGVVLVELLTRQKPISSSETEEGGNLSLATRFLKSIERNSLNTILDPKIIDQKNEEKIVAVAKLAQRCLNLDGKRRPTMKEATIELESITMSDVDSNIHANFPNPSSFWRDPTVLLDSNYTWTRSTESDSFALASDENPLLCNTA